MPVIGAYQTAKQYILTESGIEILMFIALFQIIFPGY